MADQATTMKARTARPEAKESHLPEGRMEHRLGARMPLSVPVWLQRAGELPLPGRMLNVSLSGAYVETSAGYPLLARISIACALGLAERAAASCVAAYVTRVSSDGVGLEWFEFAPAVVRQLMRAEKIRARSPIAASPLMSFRAVARVSGASAASHSLTPP